MADNDLTIKATLDAQDAKHEAEELGRSAETAAQGVGTAAQGASSSLGDATSSAKDAADAVSGAGDAAKDAADAAKDLGDAMSDSLHKAGNDADELSRRLDNVADSVGKINARQLLGAAGHIAGMGFDVWDAMHPGENSRSTVAGGGIQGIFSGAAAGAAFGPWGMLIGALGGAGLGAFTNQRRLENAEAEEAAAKDALVKAGGEYVRTLMDQMDYTRRLDEFMARLGDTSASVAERQADAARRLSELGERQQTLKWAMQQDDVLGDPKKLHEITAEYQRNAAEIKRIETFDIREERTRDDTSRTLREKTENFVRRTQVETDQLARIGINAGGDAPREVSEINKGVAGIARTLERIASKPSGGGSLWQ